MVILGLIATNFSILALPMSMASARTRPHGDSSYSLSNLVGAAVDSSVKLFKGSSETVAHHDERMDVNEQKANQEQTANEWKSALSDANSSAAAGGYSSAMSGANSTAGTASSIAGNAVSTANTVEGMKENASNVQAKAITTTAKVSNATLLKTNSTDSDNATKNNVAGATLEDFEIVDGKVVKKKSSSNETTATLAEINAELLKEASSQQANQTSAEAATSYQVQTADGTSVILTKNTCYQKTTEKCLQNYTYGYTDSSGTYRTSSVPLNTLEYLAGSTQVTTDMIQQARRQEAYTKATNSALSSDSALTVNPIETVTSTVTTLLASGADAKSAIFSGLLTYASQLQSADTIKEVKEYGRGLQEIQKAKDDAVYLQTEKVQQAKGILSGEIKNKRFRPRLIPDIPVINSGKPIKVSLITTSGKVNDETQYKVYATVTNQKTQKKETFTVKENTPFIVELPEWTTMPGQRNVEITYEFANSAVKERYSFSYTVGQLATAILPDGKAVSNSVTALASNKDILNYNSMGQSVAGRIKDVKWDNGTCFMEMTDAKDDSNVKYPTVVVASDKVSQSTCTADNLKNKYISMKDVTARQNDDGEYIYVDNSDGKDVSIMNESGYNALENDVVKATNKSNDVWDNTTLKVSDDGTIYEALPGELGVNYLNLDVGNGKKVNVSVAVNSNTGEYVFAKADGTAYTKEELQAKGINTDTIKIGINSSTSLLAAYDTGTGKVISNNEFEASDTSNLSRQVSATSSSSLTGQAVSTFSSVINGTTNAVSALLGNVGSVGSGTFATLTSATLGNETALSSASKDAAQTAALKLCSTVPDRCKEAMNATK